MASPPAPSFAGQHNISASINGPESLTDLEREVLAEYVRLKGNLDALSTKLSTLSETPTGTILEKLRILERKTSLVSTLLKASVYSIVLQQEVMDE
ncbi:hypothetical protein MMC25_003533 [Agyrium rufum]|nr:hypothetical protein [Agyrium rufum]